MSSRGSIPFDRAAEVYDETRGLSAEASAAITDLLRRELEARQPCLEIGVGTGLIGLPLHRAGIRMVGVDLSAPMLRKLVEKAEGRLPFPLIIGDATRLPFTDDVFGAALARHVLHLVPLWRDALTELVRVVRSRGVLLINIGSSKGPWQEIGDHLDARIGETARRVGLDFSRGADLDEAMAALGARARELPTVWQESDLTMARYFGEVEAGVYSWTWNVLPDLLAEAVAETRAWAGDRFGDFDRVLEPRSPSVWRAYDLP
ncbi:MAG: class I SAM-dependent methyltransferase [Actinobacteria bacterium]|nr:MAG: class I SAM-dependent methyltransferase [Actinomycetota bacterium]